MSDNECYPNADIFTKPNFPKFPNRGFNTGHDNRELTVIEFFESRICPNTYRMFRSVDWTHDMIIVKWHLFIWHERKLCALTNAPPVQSTQAGNWLSTLFHANCSAAQVLCLVPSAIHLRSKLQATTILAGITIHWALRKIFWKIFCVSNDDKCNGENMS